MFKRRSAANDEIFQELEGFDGGSDQVFTEEDFDRDTVFRQAEAPKGYSPMKKLWCRIRKKTCTPGMTTRECLKFSGEELALRLRQAGFYKINAVPVADLPYRQKKQVGMTASVTIGGQEDFRRQTEFPFDAPVQIQYHILKRIPLGFGPHELKTANVCDTAAYFKHQGFGVVKTIAIADLKMGWLKIDGQIEKVLVDGFDRFRPESEFPADTEILIYYHTFKNGR